MIYIINTIFKLTKLKYKIMKLTMDIYGTMCNVQFKIE